MATETIIFIGVGIYVVLMLAVGIYAAKKNETAADFIVAGRQMPMFLCTATIIATWFGGGTMMGASGSAYDDGLLGVIADPFGAVLVLLLIGMFFARFYRRLRLMTFIELIEQRFGKTAASIATFTHVLAGIGWVAGMLVTFGLLFESLTGTPMYVGIFAGAAIVVVYTMIGGLWAVAMTDALQVGIILVGIIVLFVVVLIDAGGWGAISARIPDGTFRMIPIENSGEKWLNYIRMWLIFGLADIGSQSLLGIAAMARFVERITESGRTVDVWPFTCGLTVPAADTVLVEIWPTLVDLSDDVSETGVRDEHQVIAPGGEIRWQRWTNRALFDEGGQLVAYQAFGETLRKQ